MKRTPWNVVAVVAALSSLGAGPAQAAPTLVTDEVAESSSKAATSDPVTEPARKADPQSGVLPSQASDRAREALAANAARKSATDLARSRGDAASAAAVTRATEAAVRRAANANAQGTAGRTAAETRSAEGKQTAASHAPTTGRPADPGKP